MNDSMKAATRSLLAKHVAVDALEQQHLRRMHELVAVSGDPYARSHFRPGHFTASSFVVSPDRQRVLLIFHRKLKRWLQPGGHIDPIDADPLAAAKREVTEETGIETMTVAGDGLLDVDVHPIPAHGDEPAHEHFDLRFCFIARESDATGSDEVDGLQWLPISELAEVETDESVRRAARRLLAAQG